RSVVVRPCDARATFSYTTRFRSADVVEVVGPGGAWAEPVVDVEADPPVGRHVAQQRDALLASRADHPRAAVDVHDRGAWLFCLGDRKSTRLNSSHEWISYAVFCL